MRVEGMSEEWARCCAPATLGIYIASREIIWPAGRHTLRIEKTPLRNLANVFGVSIYSIHPSIWSHTHKRRVKKREKILWKFQCVDTEPTPPPGQQTDALRTQTHTWVFTGRLTGAFYILSSAVWPLLLCVTAEEWQSFPSHWLLWRATLAHT